MILSVMMSNSKDVIGDIRGVTVSFPQGMAPAGYQITIKFSRSKSISSEADERRKLATSVRVDYIGIAS